MIELAEKILACNGEFYTVVPHDVEVYASTNVHYAIVGCGSLRIVDGIVTVLAQVILQSCRQERLATMAVGKVGEVVLEVEVPAWCRHEGKGVVR